MPIRSALAAHHEGGSHGNDLLIADDNDERPKLMLEYMKSTSPLAKVNLRTRQSYER